MTSTDTDSPSPSILAAHNLSYRYGKVCVWEHVHFSLPEKSIAFLVGLNGTGKSTLLRCLAGWSAPQSGTITLCGEPFDDTNRLQQAQQVLVPDVPTFYEDLTAEEHVQFILGVNRKESYYPLAEELFEDFGLSAYRKQFPSSYSRGMKEKLSLIIALLLRPRLYLLDEPYAPLDYQTSLILSKKLNAAVADGATVLISCHHPLPGLTPTTVLHLENYRLRTEDASILNTLWSSLTTPSEQTPPPAHQA